ncbi:MAG: 2-dehydro-3-deoxyphosphooctonate aldolase [Phycisphaerales bacterium]|nr:MAG: 2-dehydro-3-deoxyphosphooctonate aldolase [Phycisphaerales bacterium]
MAHHEAPCVVPDPFGSPIPVGPGRPLLVIAGPCTLESLELGLEVGRAMQQACRDAGLPFVFKASFDKANRTSAASPRGPGLEQGLDWLERIGSTLGCPVTTDIHLPEQAQAVARVASIIQIPAFLCRQSDLLAAAGRHAAERGLVVNVKKGQFLSPQEMLGPLRKLHEAGCDNALLTERGTFFGYHRLVNDFIGIGDMMALDRSAFCARGPAPVCFDATHSTQLPGLGDQSGGRPDRAPMLALAAVAAGVHALFLETHPNPSQAASDGATQLPLPVAQALIARAGRLRQAVGTDSP